MKKLLLLASFPLFLAGFAWLAFAQAPEPQPVIDIKTQEAQLSELMQQHQWQAYGELLNARQSHLDQLAKDSSQSPQLPHTLLQQDLWQLHYKMRFKENASAKILGSRALQDANTLLKSPQHNNDSTLRIAAELEATYALLYAGPSAYDKDYSPIIPNEEAQKHLSNANTLARKIKNKSARDYTDLLAYLHFAACRTAVRNKQYPLAIQAGQAGTAELEKNIHLPSNVTGIRHYQTDLYVNHAWALFLDHRDIEEFVKPVHIALLQISFNDSTYRANAIQQVRNGQLNSKNFNVPFDSISNKIAADAIMAAKMHGLEEWLHDKPETTKATYYPIAYQAAELRTDIILYCNSQMQRMFDKKIVLHALYRCYETAIALATEMHRRTNNQQYLQKALHWMENMRSIFLTSSLYEEKRQQFAGIPDSLVVAFDQLQQKIVYLEQAVISARPQLVPAYRDSLRIARTQLDQLLNIFKTDYPKYYALQNQPQLPSLAEIQQQLGDSTTLLQFYEGYHNVFIFSVHKDTIQVNKYPREKYNLLLSSLIEQCTQPNLNDSIPRMLQQFHSDAHQLYQNYIAPNVPLNTSRLIVIADGNLHYLPLEALCYDTLLPNTQSFAQLPYLVRKYSISYQYALSLWYQQQINPAAPVNVQTLAMAADYQVNSTTEIKSDTRKAQIVQSFRADDVRRLRPLLAPLKGVTLEIEALSDKYRGTFYSGADANEAEFKRIAPYYGILHLAMHSVVNRENPSRSSLAFTETLDTIEDNFLMAYEIKQMQLNSALVVLSACETGYGKYERGEGVLSVGNSFFYAGSRSLITTLWQLNDQTAPPIILDFYAQLQSDLPKDQALRKAKLAFLDNNPTIAAHPAFWACFVQVGDYSPLIMSERITIWWYLIPVAFVAAIGLWARRALRQRRKF